MLRVPTYTRLLGRPGSLTKASTTTLAATERRRSRPAREQYDSQTFARAIARACRRAGVQPWSPYQLRHLAVTEVEVSFGVSAAKAVAGHKSYQATSIYTHGENELLLDIARKVG